MTNQLKIKELLSKVDRVLGVVSSDQTYDESFFEKYPQFINIRFCLVNFRNLTSPDSIKRYARYMNHLDKAGFVLNNDYIIESFKFIRNYCQKYGITSDGYADHREPNKVTESFWHHLKDRRVSAYALTFFPKITQKILTSDQEETRYYLEDISMYAQKLSEIDSNQTNKQKLQTTKQKLIP
jgi:hypothetical protein